MISNIQIQTEAFMKKKPVVSTPLRVHQDTLDQLDKFANKMGLSRNQLMFNLITIGLEDLTMLNRLGILRVGVGIRNLIDMARDENSDVDLGHTTPT